MSRRSSLAVAIITACLAAAPIPALADGQDINAGHTHVITESPQGFAWCGHYYNLIRFATQDNLCVTVAETSATTGAIEATVRKGCQIRPSDYLPCTSYVLDLTLPSTNLQLNDTLQTVSLDLNYTAPDGPTTIHLAGHWSNQHRLSNAGQPIFGVNGGGEGSPFATAVVSPSGSEGDVQWDNGQVPQSSITFGGTTYIGIFGRGDGWNSPSTVVWTSEIASLELLL